MEPELSLDVGVVPARGALAEHGRADLDAAVLGGHDDGQERPGVGALRVGGVGRVHRRTARKEDGGGEAGRAGERSGKAGTRVLSDIQIKIKN